MPLAFRKIIIIELRLCFSPHCCYPSLRWEPHLIGSDLSGERAYLALTNNMADIATVGAAQWRPLFFLRGTCLSPTGEGARHDLSVKGMLTANCPSFAPLSHLMFPAGPKSIITSPGPP